MGVNMTVKDLINELKKYKEESEVWFNMSVGCCGDTEGLGEPDIYSSSQFVVFNFPALDILDSCRKYGKFNDCK